MHNLQTKTKPICLDNNQLITKRTQNIIYQQSLNCVIKIVVTIQCASIWKSNFFHISMWCCSFLIKISTVHISMLADISVWYVRDVTHREIKFSLWLKNLKHCKTAHLTVKSNFTQLHHTSLNPNSSFIMPTEGFALPQTISKSGQKCPIRAWLALKLKQLSEILHLSSRAAKKAWKTKLHSLLIKSLSMACMPACVKKTKTRVDPCRLWWRQSALLPCMLSALEGCLSC